MQASARQCLRSPEKVIDLKIARLLPVLLFATGILIFIAVIIGTRTLGYTDLTTVLTVTTETFGTLLGIITAGLMFTQGKFSELSSELSDKSSHYLTELLSSEHMESLGQNLLSLRQMFSKLADNATVAKEENLYRRIVQKSSSMFVNVVVILGLKLARQGLPDTGLLISEMNPTDYETYEKRKASVKKDWHLFNIMRQILDTWEPSGTIASDGSRVESGLHSDVRGSLPILKLKESADKSLAKVRVETEGMLDELDEKITEIANQFHKDRITQLLIQMEQASTVRGKYFYLTLMFVAVPLLTNLMMLPLLNVLSTDLLRIVVSVTSSLTVLGVVFLLLYVHKILNV